MKKIKIKWDIKAKESLKSIYKYIKKKSPQGAIKIKKDILDESKNLPQFPNKYQVESHLGEPYRYRV